MPHAHARAAVLGPNFYDALPLISKAVQDYLAGKLSAQAALEAANGKDQGSGALARGWRPVPRLAARYRRP